MIRALRAPKGFKCPKQAPWVHNGVHGPRNLTSALAWNYWCDPSSWRDLRPVL